MGVFLQVGALNRERPLDQLGNKLSVPSRRVREGSAQRSRGWPSKLQMIAQSTSGIASILFYA